MDNGQSLEVEFLDWLYVSGVGDVKPPIEIQEFWHGSPQPPVPAGHFREMIHGLRDRGLLRLYEGIMLETSNVELTYMGRVNCQERQNRRNDPIQRKQACRDAVVRWLYSQEGPITAHIKNFLEDEGAHYEGLEFTFDDLMRAARYLKEKGLIAVDTAGFGVEAVRGHLTSAGTECVELFGGEVNDYLRSKNSQVSNAVNVYGQVSGSNIASGGSNLKQQVVTGPDLQQLMAIIDLIREEIPKLDVSTEQKVGLEDSLEQASSELSKPEPDRSALRKSLSRARQLLTGAASDMLITALKLLINKAMEKIGLTSADN